MRNDEPIKVSLDDAERIWETMKVDLLRPNGYYVSCQAPLLGFHTAAYLRRDGEIYKGCTDLGFHKTEEDALRAIESFRVRYMLATVNYKVNGVVQCRY